MPAAGSRRARHLRSRRAPAVRGVARGLHGDPVSLHQGGRDRDPRLRGRRDGEPRCDHVSHATPRCGQAQRVDPDAEGHLQHGRPRAHAHVVGRPRHDALVDRSLAERIVRLVRRREGDGRAQSRVALLARFRGRQHERVQPRRPRLHASDLGRGKER